MIARQRAHAYEQFWDVIYPLNTNQWFVENKLGCDFIRKMGPFEHSVLQTYIQKSTGEDYKPLIIGEISSHEITPGRPKVCLAVIMNIPFITLYP